MNMDEVRCEEVILCSIERRGKGKDETDPVRCITSVYSKGGDLIAEHDPALKDLLLKFADGLEQKECVNLQQIIRYMS
jgi:hypothetical protein